MATVWYANRESVKDALGTAETARANAQVDRALSSASRSVEGLLRRRFYPQLATRYFDWPQRHLRRAWRLWLDADEVISVDILLVAGTEIPSSDYFLEPANDGPPFTHIEINLASDSEFANMDTHQRAIEVTGLFGFRADEEIVGTLASDLADDVDASTTVTFTTADVGVGDILRIGDERAIVTRKTMVDSGQDLGGLGLTADNSVVDVAVSDGSAFVDGLTILIDSERMLVVDIAGNTLTVRRAVDGSTLAAHTSGADIYTLTGVELDRAQLGTTLAAHTSGATIHRHVVPGLVRELCIAEALNTIQQEQSGYARTFGSGETERLVGGRGLADIRADAKTTFGRRVRPKAG